MDRHNALRKACHYPHLRTKDSTNLDSKRSIWCRFGCCVGAPGPTTPRASLIPAHGSAVGNRCAGRGQANGLLHRLPYEAGRWPADGALATFPRALALGWYKRGLWPRGSALVAWLSHGPGPRCRRIAPRSDCIVRAVQRLLFTSCASLGTVARAGVVGAGCSASSGIRMPKKER